MIFVQKLKLFIFEQKKLGLVIIDYLQLMQISKTKSRQSSSRVITNYKIIKNNCSRI
jgi:replicative DNA helicase